MTYTRPIKLESPTVSAKNGRRLKGATQSRDRHNRKYHRSLDSKTGLLKLLKKCGTINAAARHVGVSSTTILNRLKTHRLTWETQVPKAQYKKTARQIARERAGV